jgi:putative CocE/NonD family hydrolase
MTLSSVRLQWGIKIPLRDGIHLNATLYLPPVHPDPSPVICTLTPYIGQTYHDQAMYFAAHSYPFLAIDVRGRGNSEGQFHPLLQEGRDGYDVVEWVAQQPYCNGQVTMWGGSYAGYNQWATAREVPPHLATIVPVAAPYIGVDFPMRNNIGYPYLLQWLTLVAGRTGQDKLFWGNETFWATQFREWFESGAPFTELDTQVGIPSSIFQEWAAHPKQDDYWDQYNLTAADYGKLSLPILTITGCYDTDQPGALAHYREHLKSASGAEPARHYLVIGPWDHAGTRKPQRVFAGLDVGEASLVDLQELHREWYDWTLQGGKRPAFLKKPVAYYVMGAQRWRYAETLEAITAVHKCFYLDSSGTAAQVFASGTLGDKVGCGPPDGYLHDPSDTRLAPLESELTGPVCLRPIFPTESLTDQHLIYAREGRQLIYHSAPFPADTELSGFFKLSAWLSIDQPDTDFGVAVYEIDNNGNSILLTTDVIRARYRESLREEKLIRTRDPLRYEFERFTFVSKLLKKGGRLRLIVGPIHSIYSQKNYNTGGTIAEDSVKNARLVTVKLFHDAAHSSVLYVPIGQSNITPEGL